MNVQSWDLFTVVSVLAGLVIIISLVVTARKDNKRSEHHDADVLAERRRAKVREQVNKAYDK